MEKKDLGAALVVYRRSLLEINVQVVSLGLSLALGLLALGFSGPFRWPWGALVAGVALALMALFFVKLIFATEKVYWDPGHHLLTTRRLGHSFTIPLAQVTRIRSYPAWGRTLVVWPGGRAFLHHQLLGFDSLLKTLQATRPDLFPDPRETLHLRTSFLSFLILLFFTLGVAATGLLLSFYQSFFLILGGVFALGPLVRMLFFTPRDFYVNQAGVRVRYLLRTQFHDKNLLKKIIEDRYSASGCNYYLMKFLFIGGTVILDEGFLMSPLLSRSHWISDTLELDERR